MSSLTMILAVILVSIAFAAIGASTENAPHCPPVHHGSSPIYIPDKDCSKFWECSNGTPYPLECPKGLHFNPSKNECDWPHLAGCLESSKEDSREESNASEKSISNKENKEEGGNENIDTDASDQQSEIDENDKVKKICPETNIDCPAVDGEYPVYMALSNCTQFCQCSNGVAYLHNCPHDLHFNPKLNVCDYPEDAGCVNGGGSGSGTENNESGEESGDGGSKELCPETNVDCPVEDGEFPVYIPLTNCSQFCQCSNGIAYLQNCPDGLHFNPVLNVCDWPEHAGCTVGGGGESSTESDEDNEEEGTKEQCPETNADCPAVDGEDSVYIPLSNCSQFCQCSNGIAYLHNCPGGLHFNPALNVCDWPEHAGCAAGGGSESSTESDENSGEEGTKDLCPEINVDCPAVDGEDSVYIALSNCSQFCQCSNGIAYLHNCPDGLHFNPVLNVCDWPEHAGCAAGGGGESSTESDETGEDSGEEGTKEQCPEINVDCPAVDGEDSVYIPLSNCSQFCQCSNGIAYLHNCPDGLHFNPALNVCDWPEHAGCAAGGGGESSTESNEDIGEEGTKQLCPEINVDCPAVDGKDSVYIPLSNCSQFCQCSNGIAYLHNCPDGLHFNPVLNVCDWPEHAGCAVGGGGESSTESDENGEDSGELGTKEPCPETNIDCPAIDGKFPVYIPLPNCSQFCQCSNGAAYLHNCPDGLHFNPTLNVCDWPDDAGCTNAAKGAKINGKSDKNKEDVDDSTREPCPETSVDCPVTDGEYPVYIPLSNCSQFCECSNGKAYLKHCKEGLHFNPVLNVCDWPENAGCATGGSSGEEDGKEPCPETNVDCPAVDGEFPVYIPLPSCSQFCQCSNGAAYLHNCPHGLHFNPVLNVCDSPDDAGCTNAAKDAKNKDVDDSTKEPCPETNVDCPAIDGDYPVYIPLPNCSQFCVCSNGKAYLKYCQEGLHFNPVLHVCDWPDNAGCANVETNRKIVERDVKDKDDIEGRIMGNDEEIKEHCPDASIDCPEVDGEHAVFIALANKSQFCQCSNGVAYLHHCPDGLYFNPDLNICDWPDDAGCVRVEGGGSSIDSECRADDNEDSVEDEESDACIPAGTDEDLAHHWKNEKHAPESAQCEKIPSQ